MQILLPNQSLYAYTGGKDFDPKKPTAVFIHGVLNDHSVWVLQSRYLAHHGWNVLAIDLPGHCKSHGQPVQSVAEAAATVIALLDALHISKAALIGHSFGSLIALAAAASDAVQHNGRVRHLVLVGTAYPMRVAPALLELSMNTPERAIAMVNRLSHSTLAPPPSALGPGTWLYGASHALMRKVQNSQPLLNLLYTGFKACNDYAGAESDMAAVTGRCLFVLGDADQMTPPKAAQPLIGWCRDPKVLTLAAGHSLMTERPEAVIL